VVAVYFWVETEDKEVRKLLYGYYLEELVSARSDLLCVPATKKNKEILEKFVADSNARKAEENATRESVKQGRKLQLEANLTEYLATHGEPEFDYLSPDKILFNEIYRVAELDNFAFSIQVCVYRRSTDGYLYVAASSCTFDTLSSGSTTQHVDPEHLFLPEDCSMQTLLVHFVSYLYWNILDNAEDKYRKRSNKKMLAGGSDSESSQ
jgi:hypothetical protein